jgi:hypothetical protein
MSGGPVLNEEGHLMGIHVGLMELDGDGEGVLVSAFLREIGEIREDVDKALVRVTPDVVSAPPRGKGDVGLRRQRAAERRKREEAERRQREKMVEERRKREEAERREEEQKAKKQRQVENEISLASARGVDYRKLRDLLAAGRWKEADLETERAMLKVARRESEGWLRSEDVENFSCQDLRTIDKLWVKYSNGNFGFSVQKQIYQSVGGTKEYDEEVFKEFGDKVGWRKGGQWLIYNELTFSKKHYRGHLPYLFDDGWKGHRSSFSRVEICRL